MSGRTRAALPVTPLPTSPVLSTTPSLAQDLLQALPAAVYTTDAAGRITFYNEAAAELWGCRPELGKSEFCGSWKLYWPDGTPMPHDQCPMAAALREQRPIRGAEAVAERPDGTRVPFIPYPTPLFDDAGRLTGAVNMLVDISDRHRAEQRIRDSEARYRGIFDHARVSVWEQDFSAVAAWLDGLRAAGVADLRAHLAAHPDLVAKAVRHVRVLDVNPYTLELFEADAKDRLLHSLAEVFLPETASIFIEELEALWEGRRQLEGEATLRTLAGRRIEVAFTIAFEGERFERTVVSLLDVSERARGEHAVQRLAAIVESSEDAIVAKDLNGIITSWNQGAERLFGYAAEEVIGKPITIVIPEDRLDEEPEILSRIRRGERVEHFETIRRRKDGSLVEISLMISPIRNRKGEIVGASKIARDITELKRARERQTLLLREMSHRIKNLFALAGAVITLSARTARSPEDLAEQVRNRLRALSRAHDLTLPDLKREQAERSTTLRALAETIVSPYVETDRGRVAMEGPDVVVAGHAVTSLALLLHELATNAAKYGALSVPAGHVDIDWSVEEGILSLRWTERDGPPTSSDGHAGFGAWLVDGTIKNQLQGQIERRWETEGLVIVMCVPLERLIG